MNLSKILSQGAANHGDVAAILFQGSTISYRELHDQVDRFAAGLAKLGLTKGSKVALLLGNSPEFIIAYYGIARLGAISVPINPLYTPSEIQYMLTDAEVEAVVAVAPLAPMVAVMRPMLPALQHVILVGADAEGVAEFSDVLALGEAVAEGEIAEDDLAVILYTSGTTGKPKGAMLTHRNLCSNAVMSGTFLGMNFGDIVVNVLPMFHVFCMTVCMNSPLYRGATLLVMPKFSPRETAQEIRDHQATVFAGVPTMYNFLTQHPDVHPEDMQSLRLAISGGAAMPIAVLEGFERKFNVIVSEGYGLSEASPVVTFNPIDRVRKPGTIGIAVPGCDVRVVGEDGTDREPHEVGELICRGPNVMAGYLNRPEDSAAALHDGWLHTGDLATVDEDGYFTIVDRKKDMIIVGGFNVYPREVEEVLFKHPQVAEAAVIGVTDPNYGEEVVAYVSLKTEGVTVQDLIVYCQERLAPYKVPKSVVVLDELPKNTTGKILRRELKKTRSNESAIG